MILAVIQFVLALNFVKYDKILESPNNRPVIGVITLPPHEYITSEFEKARAMLAASYVKHL